MITNCSINTNANIENALKNKLSEDDFNSLVGIFKSLTQSENIDFSGVVTGEDAKTVVDFFKDFINSGYMMSTLSFINNQPNMRKYFYMIYKSTKREGINGIVRAIFAIQKSIDNYKKYLNNNDEVIKAIKARSGLLSRLMSIYQDIYANNQYKSNNVPQDFKDSVSESVDSTNKFLAAMTEDIMRLSINSAESQKLLTRLFGKDAQKINLDNDRKTFESILDNLISNKVKAVNNPAAIDKMFLALKNIDEAHKQAVADGKSFNKQAAAIKEFKKIFGTSNLSELSYYFDNALIRIPSKPFDNTDSLLLKTLKDRLMTLWQIHNFDKKTAKPLACATYPWTERNRVTEEQWNKIEETVGNGVPVKTLIQSSNEDSLLIDFLKDLSESESNPIVEILDINEISEESSVYKSILDHEKKYGHKPSAIFVDKSLNKVDQNHDYDNIYLIKDGTTDHAFSFAELAHEWLHGLTMYSLTSGEDFRRNVTILREHALKMYNSGKVDTTGIDMSKLDLVQYQGKLIPFALTSDVELVSEAFNNIELQKFLDRIKSPFKTKKKQSIWDWLMSKIKSLVNNILKSVGHKAGTNTVLSEILVTGAAAMQLKMTETKTRTKIEGNEKITEDYDVSYTNDISYINTDDEGALQLSPARLIDQDYSKSVIDMCNDLSSAEAAILAKVNNVITPATNSKGSRLYEFSSFIGEYNKMSAEERDLNSINNTNYNSNTVAFLHLKDNLSGFGVQSMNLGINNAFAAAEKILNLDGRVVTFSNDYLNKNMVDHKIDIKLYDKLLKSGYKPYIEGDMAVWTKEKLQEGEEQKFLLDSEMVDKLNPSFVMQQDTAVIHPSIRLSESFKRSTDVLTIAADDPLYDQMKALNVGTKLIIHDRVMYFGNVTAITEKKTGGLQIAVDLQMSEYTDIDLGTFDTSLFDDVNDYEVKNSQNIELIFGAEKTSWRTSMLARDLLRKIRAKLMDVKVPDIIGVEDSETTRASIFFASNTFDSVCRELKEEYNKYVNDEDYRLEKEIDAVSWENDVFDLDWDDEEIDRRANERTANNLPKYQEMLPYFDIIAKRAAKEVSKELGIILTYYTNLTEKDEESDGEISTSTDTQDDSNNVDDFEGVTDSDDSDESDSDVIERDHWVVSSSHQDIHDTVNMRIRKVLSGVLKSTSTGGVMRDDMFNILYEDEKEVFNVLLNICAGLQTIDQMLEAIENYAASGHPNYYVIFDTIESKDDLKSLFFTGLCCQRKKIESCVTVENGEDKNTYLRHANKDSKYEWIEKSVNGMIASKAINTVFALNGANTIAILSKKLAREESIKTVTAKVIEKIQQYLKTVGIELTEDDIRRAFPKNATDKFTSLITELSGIANYSNKALTAEDYGAVSNYYKNIAKILEDAIPIAQQNRTYCEGKLYPTYNKPSYISKQLDTLRNLNKTDRRAYMDKEFKKFSQYYTKDNLALMIRAAEQMSESNAEYSGLVEYLTNLQRVQQSYGDKEVSMRLSHINDTNPELSDALALLHDENGNPLTFREGKWNYTWLEDLYNNDYVDIELSDMLSYDGKQYARLSEKEYLKAMFLKFGGQGKKIAVTVPIYADANCWNFMYCKKQGSKKKILEGFKRIMESEIARVKCVTDRHNLRLKAIEAFNKLSPEQRAVTSIGSMEGFSYPIPNYDIESKIKYKPDGTIDLDLYIAESKKSNNRNGLKYQYFEYSTEKGSMESQIEAQLNEEYNKFLDYVHKIFKVEDEDGVTYPELPKEEWLETFFWEHCYAVSQIHALSSSPVFYKNAIDFQKRFKEVYALTSRLNVNAEGGRRFERSIGLSDRILDDFKDVFKKTIGDNVDKILKKAKHLTPATKAYIKKQLSKVNATDAQGIRTPSSYIAIKKMLGEWGEDAQAAWSALNSGKMDIHAFKLLMGILKPFVRSTYTVSSKTDYGDIKVPLQHKNSEFMSVYGHDTSLTSLGRKELILSALTDFMEAYNIDIANFESAVKVGNQAPIDLNNCKSYKDAIDTLHKACGIEKGSSEYIKSQIEKETDEPFIFGNPEVIKTIPYQDWGIVAPNPEHFTDKRMKIGSQIRRVMKSDILANDDYEFEDVVWNRTKNEDGSYSYKRETKTRTMKGSEVLEAYDKSIKDNLSISFEKLEELFRDKDKLAAFLDETITNDNKLSDDIKGLLKRDENGDFIAMADPQYGDKIHQILMSKIRKTITEQKIAGGTCVQVSCMWDNSLSLHFKEDSKGNTVVDYADCYLPCYMKQLYSFCINDFGFLDLDRLKQECMKRNAMDTYEALTTMIGYRTPTEGVSSAIPLRVKGFMPPLSGSCIVLPKEITFLSGSDFDVDKLYIMRHEFIFDKDGFPRVAKEGTKGNNNKLVDMMLGLMSTQQYAEKFLNPSGSFDDLKKSVNIINILNNTPAGSVSVAELRKLDPDAVEDFISDNNIKITQDSASLLSPQFQSYYHEQNFSGKNLLATWAVYKSAIDLLQYCNIEVTPKYQIKYNKKTKKVLCPQFIKDGKTDVFLTQIIKQYLAASADNTKDPVQFKLGITQKNVQAVAYLSLMGLDSTSVALIIRAANMCTKDVKDIKRNEIAGAIANLGDDTLAYPNNDTIEAAAVLMSDAAKAGKVMSDMISCLREDSQKGALKENIYKTLSLNQKIKSVMKNLSNGEVFIVPKGETLLMTEGTLSSKVQNKSLVGNVQQFYDYGVRSYFEFTGEMFPEFNNTFEDAYSLGYHTKNGYMSESNFRDMTNHLYYYHILGLEFFGNSIDKNGNKISTADKIKSYKENMPKYFKQFMVNHPNLYNNQFIKRLQLRVVGNTEVLTLPNAFQYERGDMNTIRNAFLDLFTDEDREVRVLAWNLVKYSIYRQGFQRKADGYGHFISRDLLTAIPGYTELMRDLQLGNVNNGSFKMQFLCKNTSFTQSLPVIKVGKGKGKIAEKIFNELYSQHQHNYQAYPKFFICKNRLYALDELLTSEEGVINTDYRGYDISKEDGFISYDTEGYNIDTNSKSSQIGGEGSSVSTTSEDKGYFQRKQDEKDNNPSEVC